MRGLVPDAGAARATFGGGSDRCGAAAGREQLTMDRVVIDAVSRENVVQRVEQAGWTAEEPFIGLGQDARDDQPVEVCARRAAPQRVGVATLARRCHGFATATGMKA